MTDMLPWTLLITWSVFFGFLNTHIRHSMKFEGNSRKYEIALTVSVILGSITLFSLLIMYFLKVSWYFPLAIFVLGAIISGLIFGVLDGVLGRMAMSFAAFIGWPIAAVWVYINILNLSL